MKYLVQLAVSSTHLQGHASSRDALWYCYMQVMIFQVHTVFLRPCLHWKRKQTRQHSLTVREVIDTILSVDELLRPCLDTFYQYRHCCISLFSCLLLHFVFNIFFLLLDKQYNLLPV